MPQKNQKPRMVATEWLGFKARLKYAVDERLAHTPGLTQNEIATSAGVDSGNLSKMLAGTKTNVVASTVIQLAKALRVPSAWLLTGQEPSGLGPVDVQAFDGIAPGTALNQGSDVARKSKPESGENVVGRPKAKRDKR